MGGPKKRNLLSSLTCLNANTEYDRVSSQVERSDGKRTTFRRPQHEHPHWIFFERDRSLFRLDLVIDPVAYPPSVSFLCFTLGTLFRSLLRRRGKRTGQWVYRVL